MAYSRNLVSISASIIAAGAVLYNSWKTNKTLRENNKESIKANLTTKARIEWIEKVRELIAEFVAILFQWGELYDEYKSLSSESKNQTRRKELNKLLDEKKDRIDILKNLIKLYFPNDEDKTFLNHFEKSMNLLISSKNDPEKKLLYHQSLNELIEESRSYLKKEWDKTKIGE